MGKDGGGIPHTYLSLLSEFCKTMHCQEETSRKSEWAVIPHLTEI